MFGVKGPPVYPSLSIRRKGESTNNDSCEDSLKSFCKPTGGFPNPSDSPTVLVVVPISR